MPMTTTDAILIATPNQYEALLNNYASILEKTNDQMGLWLNIGNWITAILSVIVSLIAIGAAILFWYYSSEQKKERRLLVEQTTKAYEKALEKFDKESKRQQKEATEQIDSLLKEKTAQLAKADQHNKAQIQKAIDDLNATKATIGAQFIQSPSVYVPNYSVGTGINDHVFMTNATTGSAFISASKNLGDVGGMAYTGFCKNCHRGIPIGAAYCGHCGTKI